MASPVRCDGRTHRIQNSQNEHHAVWKKTWNYQLETLTQEETFTELMIKFFFIAANGAGPCWPLEGMLDYNCAISKVKEKVLSVQLTPSFSFHI